MSVRTTDREAGTPRLKLAVEIDRDVYSVLREVSKSCGLSMSNYVRSLLYTHLASKRDNTGNTTR